MRLVEAVEVFFVRIAVKGTCSLRHYLAFAENQLGGTCPWNSLLLILVHNVERAVGQAAQRAIGQTCQVPFGLEGVGRRAHCNLPRLNPHARARPALLLIAVSVIARFH